MSDEPVVEIIANIEDNWGDAPHQVNEKVLIDTDDYDEDFNGVLKKLEWEDVHYSAEYDDDDNWRGWSVDRDSLDDVKTHLYEEGYMVVDIRDD